MSQETFVERIEREWGAFTTAMRKRKWLIISIVFLAGIAWIVWPFWSSYSSTKGKQLAGAQSVIPTSTPSQNTTTASATATSSSPCAMNVSNGAGMGLEGITLETTEGNCLVSDVGSGTKFYSSNSAYKVLPK